MQLSSFQLESFKMTKILEAEEEKSFIMILLSLYI